MSTREKVVKNLNIANADELKHIRTVYEPMLKTARKCSAEDVIYTKAEDSFRRDTLVHPRISHDLIAGIFSKINQQPEYANNYAKLLGKYLLPLCSIEDPEYKFPCEMGTTHQVFCQDTEEYFVDSLVQVKANIFTGQPRLSVYHDEDGNPFAFRKSAQETSALLLQDTITENLHIPKGTYVGICKDNQAMQTGSKKMHDKYDSWLIESYCIDDGFKIAPGRLSPWAHNLETDRELFGIEKYRNIIMFNSYRSKQCAKYNLESFKKISGKILRQIGI
ncbi:hypothetical protein KA043_01090 [Candidatus Saccharibacteria bacterium]|jgi:hypothetical protein|nr:hypothetical protein [Candidatus Saccharibacteria bacterium]